MGSELVVALTARTDRHLPFSSPPSHSCSHSLRSRSTPISFVWRLFRSPAAHITSICLVYARDGIEYLASGFEPLAIAFETFDKIVQQARWILRTWLETRKTRGFPSIRSSTIKLSVKLCTRAVSI